MPDRYVLDSNRQPVPVDEEVIPAGPVPGDPVRHVWLTFTRYARIVGASVRVGTMECNGCHRKVAASDLWSVMPVDDQSIICGPGYLYCGVCRLGESPEHAYAHADVEWKQNRHRKPRGKPEVQLGKQVRI